MNILHLIHNLNRDGAQKIVYYLATGDQNSSNRHIVCAWKRGGPLKKDFDEQAIPVFVPGDNSHSLKKIRRVLKYLDSIIESQNIDIIHAHMADGAFWGSLASFRHSIPMLITHHGNNLVPQTPLYFKYLSQLVLLFTARFAKINVTVSGSVKAKLKKLCRLNENKIVVVKNGVPISKESDPAREDKESKGNTNPDFSRKGPNIVAIGRLIGIKGQDQLIDAAPAIVQRFPNARFTFLGTGPLKSDLEQRAKKLNMSDHCIFPGTTNDVSAYLERSDLYVTTSHHEGIPVATLEAMAYGVPIVSSDVTGNRDIVTDEATGLLYPLGDTSKLAQAIFRLLENPSLSNSLASNGKKFIESEFSLEKMALHYDALYKQLSGRN